MRSALAAGRLRNAAGLPSVASRAVSWYDLRPGGYDAANDRFTDQSGRGHHAQLGSIVGADAADVLVVGWDPTNGIRVRHPGLAGNYWSVPVASIMSSLIGDFTIDIILDPDTWAPATQQAYAAIFASSNQVWRVSTPGTGTSSNKPRFEASTNGTSSTSAQAGVAYPWGTGSVGLRKLRIDRIASTGQVRYYTSAADLTTLTLLDTKTGPTGNLFTPSGSPVLEVGSSTLGTAVQTPGYFHRVTVYASALGTGSGTPILDLWPQGQLGAEPFNTFVESGSGLTVTLNQTSTSGLKLYVIDRGGSIFGSARYLIVPDHADFGFAHDQPFTVAVAARIRGTTADQVLMAKKADLTTGAGFALTRGTANAEKFIVGDGTVGPPAAGPAFTQGVACVLTGVRRPVAGTIRAANTTAAADNNTSATDTTTATVSNGLPLYIGALAGSSNFLDAFVFRAGVWREYLSAGDRQRLAAEWLVAAT